MYKIMRFHISFYSTKLFSHYYHFTSGSVSVAHRMVATTRLFNNTLI